VELANPAPHWCCRRLNNRVQILGEFAVTGALLRTLTASWDDELASLLDDIGAGVTIDALATTCSTETSTDEPVLASSGVGAESVHRRIVASSL
jgi:hypothetical protein